MKQNNRERIFHHKKLNMDITYFDLEMMKEKHPNGEYTVAGEIDNKTDSSENSRMKKPEASEQEIPVQPLGTYKESRYKTLGYISCENGEYIVLKKKKTGKYLLLLLLLAILLAAGGILYMNRDKKPDIDPHAQKYESALKRPAKIDDSKILIPGYGKFTIQKGSNTIDTVLFNPEGNPCYFQFTLVEKETGKVLYKSKLVPPGDGITPIKMNKTFEKDGTYKAVLKFETTDFENPDIHYNGSDSEVDLIVVG